MSGRDVGTQNVLQAGQRFGVALPGCICRTQDSIFLVTRARERSTKDDAAMECHHAAVMSQVGVNFLVLLTRALITVTEDHVPVTESSPRTPRGVLEMRKKFYVVISEEEKGKTMELERKTKIRGKEGDGVAEERGKVFLSVRFRDLEFVAKQTASRSNRSRPPG